MHTRAAARTTTDPLLTMRFFSSLRTLSTSAVALTLCAALSAQGSFAIFGTGCPLQGQTPSIGSAGTPQIGTTLSITYTGPNYQFSAAQQYAQPYLALGVQPMSYTIPAGALLYQPAGCTGYLVPITLMPMPPAPGQPTFESSYDIAIPKTPSVVGFQFMAQWLLVHTQCGFGGCSLSGLITSDAAVITVGL